MKKIILSLALIIAGTTAFSQVTFKPGVRAGLNYATITKTSLKHKANYYGGLFIEMRFAEMYALQPEVIYSKQGGKSEIDGAEDLVVDYISIGIISKFFFLKDKSLHALIGPSIDTNINENFISLSNGQEIQQDVTPIDFTLIAGIGYDFDFGLTVEARFKHGIIDTDYSYNDGSLYEETNNNPFSNSQLNNVIQLGVSYKFDFSK